MALSNQERVGKAMDLLRDGLNPFIEREMRSRFGDTWKAAVQSTLAYARQLHDQGDLPAGGFETQFTFAQALRRTR